MCFSKFSTSGVVCMQGEDQRLGKGGRTYKYWNKCDSCAAITTCCKTVDLRIISSVQINK
ncbi:hypothetical protein BpHYR1_034698 [Brachionus plicatilis]|uniref:Uncharacterized protein n=1 Tax=Brachionus plicatilis TaxID=10195 RepID=A0A3M7SHR6_BRAPC|nr:hypothetical protein BpHYR1_034698 [Brachionus plicatilis]